MKPKTRTSHHPKKKRFYTTFEIARILGVFPSTVINWIKKRHLEASQTPGGHRRVTTENLISFMKRQGYHIPSGMDNGVRSDTERLAFLMGRTAWKGGRRAIDTAMKSQTRGK